MPEIIPTEQVRADEIKERDTVWYDRRWLEVTSTAVNGDVLIWGLRDWCVDFHLVPTERVLRQAAPAFAAVTDEMRAWGDRVQSEASRIIEWARGRRDIPYEVGMAVAEVESAIEDWTELRRQENTGGEEPIIEMRPSLDELNNEQGGNGG